MCAVPTAREHPPSRLDTGGKGGDVDPRKRGRPSKHVSQSSGMRPARLCPLCVPFVPSCPSCPSFRASPTTAASAPALRLPACARRAREQLRGHLIPWRFATPLQDWDCEAASNTRATSVGGPHPPRSLQAAPAARPSARSSAARSVHPPRHRLPPPHRHGRVPHAARGCLPSARAKSRWSPAAGGHHRRGRPEAEPIDLFPH